MALWIVSTSALLRLNPSLRLSFIILYFSLPHFILFFSKSASSFQSATFTLLAFYNFFKEVFICIFKHFKNITCSVYDCQSWSFPSVSDNFLQFVHVVKHFILSPTGALFSALLHPQKICFYLFQRCGWAKVLETILSTVQNLGSLAGDT